MNLYAYAGNNPIHYSDPWGLDSVQIHDPKLKAEYEAGKQSLADCVAGGCSDPEQVFNAAIGLSMIHYAEAAQQIIDVYGLAIQGGPTANRPNGAGRVIGIDAGNSVWGTAATLSSGVVHEVLEGYLAIGAGNPDFKDRTAWEPLHSATVRFAEDPILSAVGYSTRTARSPNGDTTKRPGPLFWAP